MKQLTASLAALVLGIGVGVGIGMTVSKSKVNASKMEIEDLQAQMEASEAESEKTIQKDVEKITQLNNTLAGNQAIMNQLKTDLTRTRAELAQLKSQNQPVVTTPPTDTVAESVSRPPSTVSSATTPSTEYIVKDGDSLWKIAEQQLGDGMRYKEILLLNPNISEKQTLVVGTKLKIPSQKN
jgi:nucleoid-associated protein YgaU